MPSQHFAATAAGLDAVGECAMLESGVYVAVCSCLESVTRSLSACIKNTGNWPM